MTPTRKQALISLRSFIGNGAILLGANYFFGFQVAVLIGFALVVATIDEFGYTR